MAPRASSAVSLSMRERSIRPMTEWMSTCLRTTRDARVVWSKIKVKMQMPAAVVGKISLKPKHRSKEGEVLH